MARGHEAHPWTERMESVLREHHPLPVPRETLIRAAMDMVPPGIAHRTWVKTLKWTARDRGYLRMKTNMETPNDKTIRAGSRRMVNTAIIHKIRAGLWAIAVEDGVEYISIARERKIPSHEEYVAWARNTNAQRSRSERSEISRKSNATIGRERKAQMTREAAARMTPEARRERSLRGWATRRAKHGRDRGPDGAPS